MSSFSNSPLFRILSPFAAAVFTLVASADPEPTIALDKLVVYGRSVDFISAAKAASEGQVGPVELAMRPFLRRGELLEVVPGLVVTQHSGSGKANQYFLRGFNLDHGTDFAVSVDGMPVNMRSHAHGQGYADVNFIIPELVQNINYQKGAFFAENGDFSAAGAAQFHLVPSLTAGLLKVEVGENQYARLVVGETVRRAGEANAATTIAGELSHYDGPWDRPEGSRRLNALVRHVWSKGDNDFTLTAMAYDGRWNSTDQVPLTALESGLIGRFGTLDPTDGGNSSRFSLSFDRTRRGAKAVSDLNLYAIYSRLNLYSNFNYFLNDPVNGDQFNQRENRLVLGGSAKRTWDSQLAGHDISAAVGVQVRDDIISVGLRNTSGRTYLSTVRQDDIQEASAGVFGQGVCKLAPWLRVEGGARSDFYFFDVASDTSLNSGNRRAAIFSPKLGLVAGPWAKTEFYANAGYGFHSNDARGTTIRVDPSTLEPVARVNPLVRAKNAELGVRTAVLPGLVSTVSVWALDLDSELVFVGDEGATEPSGPTRRYGVEFANFYRVNSWLALDADVSFTHARYRGGDRITNSIATVVTGGAAVDLPSGWFGSLRARYFGPQPLIEDNSVVGPSSLTYNLRLGWHGREWEVAFDVLNFFDRKNADIAYYSDGYRVTPTSPPEDGMVLHPAEPRAFRISVTRRF